MKHGSSRHIENRQPDTRHPDKIISSRVIAQLLFFVVIVPLLPIVISWQWGWWEAWVFFLVSILSFVISRVLAARRHPDLLAERAHFMHHEDTKSWDRLLVPLVGLGGVLIPLVAGLDALFHWSGSFSLLTKTLSLVVIMIGHSLSSYALRENRFFSGVVRIQTDRGHHVISTGPYRWMRHPGYAGAILAFWATPLFLDSGWVFLPVAFVTIILIVRTNLEDRVLRDELDGYREYTERVRYRLLPGVW